MIRHAPAMFVVVAIVAACADDPDRPLAAAKKTAGYVTIDAEAICRIFTTDCERKSGQTYQECVEIYKAARVPPECKPALEALTCESTQAELDGCWPVCSGLEAECDGPNIIECSTSGRRYTYDCAGVCATQDKTWSGSCGTSYKGQTAGRPTCWCN